MCFFAWVSSNDSWVVRPGRSPRSIWSCRTQLCRAPMLMPSSAAVAVMVLPARPRATAHRRNRQE